MSPSLQCQPKYTRDARVLLPQQIVPLLTTSGNQFLYNIIRLYDQRIACKMDFFAEEVDGSVWLWSDERGQYYTRAWDGKLGMRCEQDLGSALKAYDRVLT